MLHQQINELKMVPKQKNISTRKFAKSTQNFTILKEKIQMTNGNRQLNEIRLKIEIQSEKKREREFLKFEKQQIVL